MRGILHTEDFGWAAAPRFGGGGGTTTSVQKSDPWSGQQPYLSDVMARASDLQNGTPPQYYPDSTYAAMTPDQKAAYAGAYNLGANGGTPALQGAQASNIATTSPGYTGQTQNTFDQITPALNTMGNGTLIAGAQPAYGQGQGYLSNTIGGGYLQPTSGTFSQNQGLLSDTLSGKYLDPSTNPGFQSVVNTTLANVMPAVTAPFVGAGRSDSGLASRAASEGATDAIGNLTLQNYQAERANQNQAATNAANQYEAERQLQSGAAGQAAQNYATGLGATEAAQGLASNNLLTQQGNALKGQAIAPTLDQSVMSDILTGAQAAGATQQDQQNWLSDQVARWNYNQSLPWNQLGLYNSMIQGNYGGTTSLTQPYYSNTGANIMSGVGAAASVAGTIAAIV